MTNKRPPQPSPGKETFYRGYLIGRSYLGEWVYVHNDYDLGDPRHGWCNTYEECLNEIDEREDE